MITIYQGSKSNFFKNTEIPFNSSSYIVSINNREIGHFNISLRNRDMMIDYELLKDYRGKNLGTYFLSIIEDYLISHFDFDRFLLMIKYDNVLSRKVALNNDYDVDYLISEKISIDGEMTGYIPYYKLNSNIKRKY